MKKHEASYLVTVIGAMLCLSVPTYFLGKYISNLGQYPKNESEVYFILSSVLFPSLAIIGSFLYLRRRGVPGKTRCLFLLLNPATLYLLWFLYHDFLSS